MAITNFSIEGLYEQAFGVGRGKPFDGNLITKDEAETIEYEATDEGTDEGTEFLTVRNELDTKLPNGSPIFMPVKIGDLVFQNEPAISFSKEKRVVKTPLVGSRRKGTVKELISSDDWVLTIRGVVVNYESTLYYPEDQVAKLVELDSKEEALPIVSALTSLLGIYRVVITNFKLTEMIGIQHAQAYEITAISDEDFLLELD